MMIKMRKREYTRFAKEGKNQAKSIYALTYRRSIYWNI